MIAPIIPSTKPTVNPARRPITFINKDAGIAQIKLPKKTHAKGNVAQILFPAKIAPIRGDVVIISDVADIIKARHTERITTFLLIKLLVGVKFF